MGLKVSRAWLAKHHPDALRASPNCPARRRSPSGERSATDTDKPAAHSPGPWVVEIPGWVPPSLNTYLGQHWSVGAKVKKRVAHVVAVACLVAQVPKATTRRRLSVHLSLPRGRKAPDEDNIGKALRDALTACGAIHDDAPEWVESGPYTQSVGPLGTILRLEEI